MGRRPKAWGPSIDGLLLIDKALGMGSTAVVARVRRAAQGCRTGHAGTLDPLATGLLICCLGRGTKAVESLMGLPKSYRAEIDLSAFTDTDDAESEPQPVACQPVPLSAITAACTAMQGPLQQTPSKYSALKIDGVPAYRLARAGKEVAMRSRIVQIYQIEVEAYAWPRLCLRVDCGRGTYIRSLARQLGEALGCGGYLTGLRRLAIGPYRVEQALELAALPSLLTAADLLPVPESPAGSGLSGKATTASSPPAG